MREPNALSKATGRHGVADINLFVLKWGDDGGIVSTLHQIGKSQRLVRELAMDSVELHARTVEHPVEGELRVHPGGDRESTTGGDQVVETSLPEVTLQGSLRENESRFAFLLHSAFSSSASFPSST